MGIEPTSEAWEASILPLYDARSVDAETDYTQLGLGTKRAGARRGRWRSGTRARSRAENSDYGQLPKKAAEEFLLVCR
jgi:hypothetical protein